MRLIAVSLLLVLACVVSACGGSQTCDKPQPYEAARPGQQIEAPDGLDNLQANEATRIPEPSRRQQREDGSPCLDYPPVLRTGGSDNR